MFELPDNSSAVEPAWRRWLPVTIAVLASPVIWVAGLIFGMEGNLSLLCVLYPVQTIFLVAYNSIEAALVAPIDWLKYLVLILYGVSVLVQFPIYSYFFFVSSRKRSIAPVLGVAHFLLVILAFVIYIRLGI